MPAAAMAVGGAAAAAAAAACVPDPARIMALRSCLQRLHGVQRTKGGKYEARLWDAGKHRRLGTFDCPVAAAQEYDSRCVHLSSKHRKANFPQAAISAAAAPALAVVHPKSHYRGVSWSRAAGKWQARLRYTPPGSATRIERELGLFDDQVQAARSFNAAVLAAGPCCRLRTSLLPEDEELLRGASALELQQAAQVGQVASAQQAAVGKAGKATKGKGKGKAKAKEGSKLASGRRAQPAAAAVAVAAAAAGMQSAVAVTLAAVQPATPTQQVARALASQRVSPASITGGEQQAPTRRSKAIKKRSSSNGSSGRSSSQADRASKRQRS